MASVYHLFSKAHTFKIQLVSENRNLELPGRKRHYAALLIQRIYRGYRVRQTIKYWHAMATKIQKVVRGWLVRWHLPQYYEEYLERINNRWYNKMATIIQAIWRGYLVRKNMTQSIKEMVRNKRLMEAANKDIIKKLRELFERMRQKGIGALSEEDRRKVGEECRQWVLYILFKTHHLLRTECKEGIYSDHGSNKKSQIEEWMSKLPMKKYMDDLRKIYNKEFAEKVKPVEYMFKQRRYRQMEDAFRNRDRSHELKPVPLKIEEDIQDKPFDSLVRPIHYPYIPDIASQEEYGLKALLRELERFSYESDFDLSVHHMEEVKPSPPPYHIDTWTKKCTLHYPPDDD